MPEVGAVDTRSAALQGRDPIAGLKPTLHVSPQRGHWIDSRRAARGQIAGESCGHDQDKRDNCKRAGIARSDTKNKRLQQR